MIGKVVQIGLLPVLLILCLANCKEKKQPSPYNVIFISLDTTRCDHIDTGGGARAYTPEIRRFCRQALVFEQAFTPIPQTLPAHLTVLSAHLPNELGVLSNEHEYDGRVKTIQEVLKERGYFTAGVISLGTLSSRTGFHKGFDDFCEDLFTEGVFFVPAEKITEKALDMIHQHKDKNFFLFLHYSDPHSPYAPPQVKADFRISVDGKQAAAFNAYHGAILRLNIPLKRGSHRIGFKIDSGQSQADDFNHFIIRRLRFGRGTAASLNKMTFDKDLYGGCHKLKGSAGSIRVDCPTDTHMKLFQVIPILKYRAAADYYRQEVEYMDRSLGRLLRRLESSRLLNRTIVVIFADHGEGLGERAEYFGHVRYLNQQFIHVPLIMHLPQVKPKRIQTPVSLTTISPTVLEFMQIRDDGFDTARSSLRLIRDQGQAPLNNSKTVYSFAFAPTAQKDKFSIIHWPYQGIFYLDGLLIRQKEFYDLSLCQSYTAKDQLFGSTIIKYSKAAYNNLQREIKTARRAFLITVPIKVMNDEATMAKLQTLGYIRN